MTTPLQPSDRGAALEQALAVARRQAGADLWQALCDASGADDRALEEWLRESQGVELVSDQDLAQAIAVASAALAQVQARHALLNVQGRKLLLAEDPWAPALMNALNRPELRNVQPALARAGQLRRFAAAANAAPAPTRPDAAGGAPVVRFVDAAIARAYADGASDIHFESDRAGITIKYRLDGVMVAGERLDDAARAEEAISRIKVLAQLDITERRRPQDGRIRWTSEGGDSVDLRVSIMPSIFGEDAVLRLLDKAQLRHGRQAITLDALGFDAATAARLRAIATRPHGMLLITGPTGSGKTTTVYAALSEVNDGLEKIVTIEDPVEYELPGVLQIPVNEQKGLTFATGLRSILRHDPDKILVGEIRDAETAEIAVQSSLTGHLVFTTVHANSLFDVLGRFQHFGIERFALASALNGVVIQRLLRHLCPRCMQWREATDAERQQLAALDLVVPERLPVACGCAHCRNTGYRNRFVVAEVHEIRDSLRDLIVGGEPMTAIRQAVYQDGQSRLLAQAVRKVGAGATSLEEVSRVVGLF